MSFGRSIPFGGCAKAEAFSRVRTTANTNGHSSGGVASYRHPAKLLPAQQIFFQQKNVADVDLAVRHSTLE
jgi:hypothetical protein